MDKFGYEKDDEKTKQAEAGAKPGVCPACGTPLTEAGLCPKHGSEPFEKRPEEKKP